MPGDPTSPFGEEPDFDESDYSGYDDSDFDELDEFDDADDLYDADRDYDGYDDEEREVRESARRRDVRGNDDLARLLRANQLAAATGNILSSWRILTNFATDFWLTSPADVVDDQLGDYYSLAAAAADHLGLADEAIDSLRRLRDWAKTHDDHSTALVALAQLAQQALDGEASDLFSLSDPVELLKQFAAEFDDWRPHPDSHTIGEEPGITAKQLSADHAARLELAAMVAYTVASNLTEEPGIPALREHFATQVRRFGRRPPTDADRRLWQAQDLWVAGQHAEARAIATALVEELSQGTNPVAEYEANDMLGTFDMFDASGTTDAAGSLQQDDHAGSEAIADAEGTKAPADTVDQHLRNLHQRWSRCMDLALRHGVPVIALKRAVLVAQNLIGFGTSQDIDAAATLTRKMLDQCAGVPMSPVVLDLIQISAEAALATGDYRFAYKQAYDALSWSEFTDDTDRTAALIRIAAEAAAHNGNTSAAAEMLHRRSEVHTQRREWQAASHALQQLAEYTSDPEPLAEARELLDRIDYHDRDLDFGGIDLGDDEESARMARDWELAQWNWVSAMVLYDQGDVAREKAITHMEQASQLYAGSGDLFMAADCARQQAERHLAHGELADAELALRRAFGWMHDLVLFTQGLDVPPEGLPQAMKELNTRLHAINDMLGG